MKIMDLIRPYRSKDEHTIKDFKDLSFKGKLVQLWDYYKVPIFLVLLCIYIGGYSLYRHYTTKLPQLYEGFVNVAVGETLHQALTDGFIASLPDAGKRDSVQTYDDLLITENVSSADIAYMQASQMKILASIDGEMLDLVFMNQEAYDAFSQNGYLMNMEDFLLENDAALYDKVKDSISENLEILSDNSTEVMADRSIAYESETTTYPMALVVNDSPYFADAGFTEPVYMGILKNTPRADIVLTYVNYLYI